MRCFRGVAPSGRASSSPCSQGGEGPKIVHEWDAVSQHKPNTERQRSARRGQPDPRAPPRKQPTASAWSAPPLESPRPHCRRKERRACGEKAVAGGSQNILPRHRPASQVQAVETHRQGPASVDGGLRTMGAAENVSSKKCFAIFRIKVHPYPFCPEVGSADPSWRGEPRNPAGATDATQKA